MATGTSGSSTVSFSNKPKAVDDNQQQILYFDRGHDDEPRAARRT